MISAIGRDDPELSCIGNFKYDPRGRRPGIDQWLARCLAAVSACWWLLGCTEPDVGSRVMLEAFVSPSAILGREVIPLTEERIHVRGDGRDISAIVMLPDNITGQLSAILSTWRSTILAAVPDGSPE